MTAAMWGRSALLLAGLALAGLVLRGAGLSDGIAAAGANGPAAFVALGALLCTVGVPRQVVAFAGGSAFGFWPGAGLALVCEVIGAAVDYGWAHGVARDWARRRIGSAGRIARLHAALVARPFVVTLVLRLLPVGNNVLLNLAAGTAALPLLRFLAASALGYVPQTVVFALLGQGVQVDRSVQVMGAIALFAVSAGLGWALMRRTRLA